MRISTLTPEMEEVLVSVRSLGLSCARRSAQIQCAGTNVRGQAPRGWFVPTVNSGPTADVWGSLRRERRSCQRVAVRTAPLNYGTNTTY